MHQKFLDQEFRVLNVCFFLAASCETLDSEQQQQSSLVTLLLFVSLLVLLYNKRGKRQRRRDSILLKMASTSPAQLAAQMLGSLARVGAFVGVGATAVTSAMYDGTRSQIIFSRESVLFRRRHPFLYYYLLVAENALNTNHRELR